MYHFGDTQLRIVRTTTRQKENAEVLCKGRLLVLEHILPTTAEFLRQLQETGAEIFALIAKPYSIQKDVLKTLADGGIRIIEETYKTLEETNLLDQLLQEANQQSAKDGRQIAILDVGGYFAKPLSRLTISTKGNIVGVIEDTTFGYNRYHKLRNVISVPICSVARSELKEIEARFVGRDAVQAMDHILRQLGISITGRNALVIGYGMLGKNVARTLRGYDLNVYVYDIEDRQLLKAFTDGFHIHKKGQLLRHADIIFSATGSEAIYGCPAMSYEEIEDCKNGVILASVGSKDSEFDVRLVGQQALDHERLSDYLVKYNLPNSKYVIVAKEGTAVNFILPSMSVEILDLVFSEILEGLLTLLRGVRQDSLDHAPVFLQPGTLHGLGPDILNRISKAWLRLVNMEAQA